MAETPGFDGFMNGDNLLDNFHGCQVGQPVVLYVFYKGEDFFPRIRLSCKKNSEPDPAPDPT